MPGELPQKPPEVFISHSSKDGKVAMRVCSSLEAEGLSCWIAPRNIPPGRTWAESIIHAIHQCRLILLLFSSNADASRQIAREVERADNRGLPIVALRLEEIEPTGALEYFTASTQWVDIYKGPLKTHMQRLIPDLRALLPRTKERRKESAEKYYSQGYQCLSDEEYARAAGLFTKYLRTHPDDAAGYNLRGHAYNEAGKYQAAIADFTHAIELRPEFGEAYFHRATAYIRDHQAAAGIRDLQESLRRELDPFFVPYAHYNLGGARYEARMYKRALRSFDEAIRLKPDLGSAYYYRAQVKKALKDMRGFNADMRKAERLSQR